MSSAASALGASVFLQKKFVKDGPGSGGGGAGGSGGAGGGGGSGGGGRSNATGRLAPPTARIASVEFGVLTGREVTSVSHMEVVNRSLYDAATRHPQRNGPLDRRLGTSDKKALCETCQRPVATCVGHFGHVKLCLPVFHIGFFRECMRILHVVCKTCARVMLTPERRMIMLSRMKQLGVDWRRRALLMKVVTEEVKKVKKCPLCGAANGPVKKTVGAYRIYHDVYSRAHQDLADGFRRSFEEAEKYNKQVKDHVARVHADLTALDVLRLFRRVPEEDLPLLNMRPGRARPEDLIITNLVVPPVAIRPSVAMGSAGSNEDDLTVKLGDIVYINNFIKHALEKGAAPGHVAENVEFLASQVAMYLNADMPGFPASAHAGGKPIRAFVQRLKGKMGRFRGNLSGKRVDFSARTVISPDPNMRIDQVGVPLRIAQMLTYPERVTKHNREELRRAVLNGPDVHPGANFIEFENGQKVYLKYGKRENMHLRDGDIVERHLRDGDVVLFNRQPSLHKMSIMAHRVRVVPWRTLRFNECVCKPYNADFDGDEMNLHVPQTEEARAEAVELMGVVNNLVTPRHGEPLVTATQDFLTAAFLMTQRDVFYDRAHFMQICSYMGDGLEHIEVPPPAVVRPLPLWTGKQIIGVLLRPVSDTPLNVELKARNYSGEAGNEVMCPRDGYVVVRNSELVCGNLCKSSLGGSKAGILFALIQMAAPAAAARVMNRLSKLCARWLGERGFSFGIDDVTPSAAVVDAKSGLLRSGYAACRALIDDYANGRLKAQSGCDENETLEAKLLKGLSQVREDAGKTCLKNLDPHHNSGLTMAVCGSKGQEINIAQMVACVGQQAVGGKRIQNGFGDRALPHFKRDSRGPLSRGFVPDSFYSGLTATAFWFHTMAGREGLVDTAVKTAETGYMQRRLIKALEDMTVNYDGTVRTAEGIVVQFVYGDDGLDPVAMASGVLPCNFESLARHVAAAPQPPPLDRSPPATPAAIRARAEAVRAIRARRRGVDTIVGECRPELDFAGVHSKFLSEYADYLDALAAREEARGAEALDAPRLLRPMTEAQLADLERLVFQQYRRARAEPGTAVGAIGAQSIGEPGTQMTLNTFHFSGVASMQVTQGVPRIKEIINATEGIARPIVVAPLVTENDESSARIVKGRLEQTTLGEVCEYIDEVFSGSDCHVAIKLDTAAIAALQLAVTARDVVSALVSTPKLKLKGPMCRVVSASEVRVMIKEGATSVLDEAKRIRGRIADVVVAGVPGVRRAVITDEAKSDDEHKYALVVEGDNVLAVMGTLGVVGTHVTTNSIVHANKYLGIEAARATIAKEIGAVMRGHGLTVDPRHMSLLADIMTFRGQILGITRFGVAKMKQSILMLASFEKTADHLFEAAIRGITDNLRGVSESIVIGQPVPLGTGMFDLTHRATRVPTTAPRRAILSARSLGRRRY